MTLDERASRKDIDQKFGELEKRARLEKQAIGIASFYPVTLEGLPTGPAPASAPEDLSGAGLSAYLRYCDGQETVTEAPVTTASDRYHPYVGILLLNDADEIFVGEEAARLRGSPGKCLKNGVIQIESAVEAAFRELREKPVSERRSL